MEACKDKIWTRQDEQTGKTYIVSTKQDLLYRGFIQTAFASDLMPWAKPLTGPQLDTMLDNSITFGLYIYDPSAHDSGFQETSDLILQREQLQQIGIARVVTDYVTFAWVTDVFVLPEHQGYGCGRWMVKCLGEVLDEINHGGSLRRSMLMTSTPRFGVSLYGKELGMKVMEQDMDGLIVMTTAGKTW